MRRVKLLAEKLGMKELARKRFVVRLIACACLPALAACSAGESGGAISPTLSVDPGTATWKTYRSSDGGFVMSYPPDWKIHQLSSSSVTMLTSPDELINVEIAIESVNDLEGGDGEPPDGSFATYRKFILDLAGRDPYDTVTSGDFVVGGREAFFVKTVEPEEQPPTWAGEPPYHGGSISRFFIEWGDEKVLTVHAYGPRLLPQDDERILQQVVASLRKG